MLHCGLLIDKLFCLLIQSFLILKVSINKSLIHKLIGNINEQINSPSSSGMMRRRNRKRVGILSDGKKKDNNDNNVDSNKKVAKMKTPKKYEEIPLLLDFDDIADMTDTIEENEFRGEKSLQLKIKDLRG